VIHGQRQAVVGLLLKKEPQCPLKRNLDGPRAHLYFEPQFLGSSAHSLCSSAGIMTSWAASLLTVGNCKVQVLGGLWQHNMHTKFHENWLFLLKGGYITRQCGDISSWVFIGSFLSWLRKEVELWDHESVLVSCYVRVPVCINQWFSWKTVINPPLKSTQTNQFLVLYNLLLLLLLLLLLCDRLYVSGSTLLPLVSLNNALLSTFGIVILNFVRNRV
jgi:hypothetical protein